MECFFSQVLFNTTDFKKHPSRLYYGYPVIGSAFAAAHSGFCRFLGHRFIRKNPYPHFTAAAQVSDDNTTCGFNLPVGYPGGFKSLKAIIAELNGITSLSYAPEVSLMRFAVFDSLRL